MIDELKKLLEYLENILPADREAKLNELYASALAWKVVPRLPLVFNYPLGSDILFKPFPHREIYDNPEKMLYNELVHAFGSSVAFQPEIGDDRPYYIRANFGIVVIASMFGAKVEQNGDNPPWVRHYENWNEFSGIFDHNPYDFSTGECQRVIERCQFYREALVSYPHLSQIIRISLPDLQGPLDNAELLRGIDIYTDFYERPDEAQDVLRRMAVAQIALAKHLRPFVDEPKDGLSAQHGVMIPGAILIRNDSSIMLSPEMYREMVAPHDEYVLHELGGGGIHSCGRMSHLLDEFVALPSIRAIDIGQPELNDLHSIYRTVSEKRIPLIRVKATEKQLVSGQIMDLYSTGVSLICNASSIMDARRIMDLYLKTTGC
jgi:hypothetical protein